MYFAAILLACEPEPKGDDSGVDTPADTADADTDSDSDTDTDTGVDLDADDDGHPVPSDCDDTDPTVYPGAPEHCGDDRITDCDGQSDDGIVTVDGVSSFTDLGEALAAAVDGSEVRVCPGTWFGPFESVVAVRLVGHAGAALTILDGAESGTTLSVPGDSTIEGLTVVNGASSGDGGGIAQTSAGPLTIADCVIEGNRARRGGGLAVAPGSPVTVSGTTLQENRASEGGGIFAPSGSSIDLTGSLVVANTTIQAGGGIALEDATILGGTITENTTEGREFFVEPQGGGGLSARGTCAVTGTDVGSNVGIPGGGLSAWSGQLVLTDVMVHDNTVGRGFDGGGIYSRGVDLDLAGTTEVRGNSARRSGGYGGGLYFAMGMLTGGLVTENQANNGGGIYTWDSTIVGTTVTANRASYGGVGGGGGMKIEDSVDLVDVVVEDNRADRGGGIERVFDDGAASITGGSITGNTADGEGGGLFLNGGVTIQGTLIADNVAREGGGLHLPGFGLERVLVTLTDATVVRNQATRGGGAWVEDATLVSESSDWGIDADDNVPNDVTVESQPLVGYGAGASFTCDTACTPEP